LEATLSYNYPIWFIVLCFLLGLIYAFILYFKDNTFKESNEKTRKWLKWLSIFRFLTVSLLAFLLMAPLLKTKSLNKEQPIILFAQDNSESIEKSYKGDIQKYKAQINNLISKLSEKYDVHTFEFGDKFTDSLSFSFNNKLTNIDNALTEMYNLYSNQNIGAVILASDGNFNSGNNPIYNTKKLQVPIYPIALGDTLKQKDLILERTYYNKIVYLKDKFTIRVDVLANNCKGNSTTLKIEKNMANKQRVLVKKEKIKINKNDFVKTIDIVLDANQIGVNRFTISLDKIDNENSLDNNFQDIFIEVLDGRQKILILAESPHPDLTTIKNAINKNENYETDIAILDKFKKNVNAYDLVILHGLPSKTNMANAILNKLKNLQKPIWFILSNQSNISIFNQKQNLLKITGNRDEINNSAAFFDADFSSFTLDEKVIQNIRNLPPLNSPFGKFEKGAKASALFNQKIGNIETDYPLFVFEQSGKSKMAVLAGEGLWRWKLYDYQNDAQHETTDQIIGKTIQYLSVKNDRRQFRVNSQKNIFYENEEIKLDAELYNDSYELINSPDVNVKISDENGKEYPFVFDKLKNAYTLNAGVFSTGDYTFDAKTSIAKNKFDAKGNFTVIPLQLEQINTTANHQVLYNLSEQTGGDVYYQNQINALSKLITQKKDIKPVSFASYDTKQIINLRWLFFIVLLLLSVEWFLRKYNGAF